VEFAKACAKLALLLAVLALSLAGMGDTLAASVRVAPRLAARAFEEPLWALLSGAIAVALAVGLADFLWQRHSHRGRLMMSREEMKKERRDSEGDPHLNARRRERARALADRRMLESVPEASVVVTNPTHYAVALAWDRAGGGAPVCVAKGMDEVAARIRARALAAGVPLHPDPPTARALFATAPLGAEIRPEHYRAVAAAILFAEGVRARRGGGTAQSSSASPGGRSGSAGSAGTA
jgi:flagellar biosynthetic protein FlhB